MKRLLPMLLAILLVFTGFGMNPASAAQFSDVPSNHGFYKEIQYLLDNGVISPTARYDVNQKVSRAEVAIMVSKAVGLDGAKRVTKFKDVPATNNASGYIDSAVKAGIITGYSNGTFRPAELVDRGQMAIFLARAFKLSAVSPENFKDMSSSVASYSSVKKIIQANITTGFSNNTFRPADKLTRGQISAFIARGMQIGNKPAVPKPDPKTEKPDQGILYVPHPTDIKPPAGWDKGKQERIFKELQENNGHTNTSDAWFNITNRESEDFRLKMQASWFGISYEELISIINQVIKTGEVYDGGSFILYYDYESAKFGMLYYSIRY